MEHKENKMGIMPVNKLLISMSLPMIFSMLIQALYNIVDSIFVARISENALTAVSLAFPFQNLMIAVAGGTCVGVNAVLSRSLGQKDLEAVNKSANTGIFLCIASYLVFMIVSIFGSRLYFSLQTDIAEIIDYGTIYLKICTVLSFGIFGQFIFERLLMSTGKTVYSMVSQTAGAVINLVLDPIFIFGMFGCPEMGIAGAALATVLGQIVAMIIAIVLNFKYNHSVKIIVSQMRPYKQYVKEIYAVGIPSILMMSIGSVMTFTMNKILIGFTATATAVFGVYFKLQSFVFMPIFGLNNGMVPIVAYNYGACKRDRVVSTIKYAVIYATSVMAIGFAVFQFAPNLLLSMFNASEDMMNLGIPALRTISYSYWLAGFCIVAGSVFQALGNGIYSLVVSVLRQLVVLLPVAFLLAQTGNVNLVWLAFPIAELMSFSTSIYFLKKIISEKF